ncbi:MAG: gliding motility-associated C-terminal domain-containing protein, partial [Chitinophagales bacterium]|nr:gliding motility-associated C-terminal domain-containing protein [Chitinophagales bacterium]
LVNFSVYDQWGEKIFETDNMPEGYDGILHNKPINDGVCVFVVQYHLADGIEVYSKPGNITLLSNIDNNSG